MSNPAKQYYFSFGSGDPRTNTGLSPSFIYWFDSTGVTQAPPTPREVLTGSGIYGFTLSFASTLSFAFIIDGVTTGLGSNRYIVGSVDPILAIDQNIAFQGVTLTAIGNTTTALGNTAVALGMTSVAIGTTFQFSASNILLAIGTTASSIGTTSTDPVDVYGYLKRLQELQEGDSQFTASSGVWLLYNRGALGSTTLLRTKTLINNGNVVTKTGD